MADSGIIIRPARSEDVPMLENLICALGYDEAGADIAARLAEMEGAEILVLVAELEGGVVGCLSTSIMQVLHRPKRVGRISMMVVAEGLRGKGIGRMLVERAERELVARGCGLVEVTSAFHREAAHSFYEHLGYEKTSVRLARDAGADG